MKHSFRTTLLPLTLAALFAATASTAQQNPPLAEDLIRGANPVDFQNRSALPASNALRNQQRVLGQEMATGVISDALTEQAGITIFRVFEAEEDGHGADILTLTEESRFGHINSLQRILTSYIARAFEYSEEDASTLSSFVLFYNARLRQENGRLELYSDSVRNRVDTNRAGISRNFQEWPNNTQIILPLRKSTIRPGEVDLEDEEVEIGAQPVTKEDQEKIDQVQEKRKEDDIEKLTETQKELEKEQEQTSVEKEVVQKELEDSGRELEELRKDPETPPEKIAEVEKQQEELIEKVTELEQKEQQIEQKQEQVAKELEETKQKETAGVPTDPIKEQQQAAAGPNGQDQAEQQPTPPATVEEKAQEVAKELAKEQEQTATTVVGQKILFLRVFETGQRSNCRNELWYIDTANDDALFRSSYTNICSREFLVVPNEGIVVIGQKVDAASDSPLYLVMLDDDKLEVEGYTDDEVHWNSHLVLRDNMIYAFEVIGGDTFLSRFAPTLALDVRGSDPISAASDITFFGDKIYLTGQGSGADGATIRVFNRGDLKMIKTINPDTALQGN